MESIADHWTTTPKKLADDHYKFIDDCMVEDNDHVLVQPVII